MGEQQGWGRTCDARDRVMLCHPKTMVTQLLSVLGTESDLSKYLRCANDLAVLYSSVGAIENGQWNCAHGLQPITFSYRVQRNTRTELMLLHRQYNDTRREHILVQLIKAGDFVYRQTIVASQLDHRCLLLEHHQRTTFQVINGGTEIRERIHQPRLVYDNHDHPVVSSNGRAHARNNCTIGEEHIPLVVQDAKVAGRITCLCGMVHNYCALFRQNVLQAVQE